ncbi:TPA: XRE family transcriptional regulator [Yersinia enterocolitica]|nr:MULTISPECIES: helix-turn-helix transcriptional regulator [Yersinia]EKN4720290.1 helix-turn-helix transcriptional regulator [Yersinia enterocolitica]EKN4732398.1 helix-turn-helix transcriptional regulator [Yersinia enterocolitica]MBX9487215.1 helix-turn-helix transcriptional regulator [Yersinia enterocolitica]MBX9493656.1 helix-turn-helix transcriptional regulator [Yersinia enterocolitica]HDX8417439.1 helix-turn-helix transcriptional regulator [Yersinia enterocolitica]
MGMTLAQRLKVAMKESGLTQAALAEKAGVSQAAIQKITSGKSQSTTKLLEISRALQVRPEWLGEGILPMKESTKTINQESNIPSENDWGNIIPWDSQCPIHEDEVEVPFLRDIELAAGDGSFCDQDYNGFKLRFSKSTLRRVGAQKENVICFPAHGNSMEPILPNGTTVAVDCANKKIIDGKIYAINQDGLKRLKLLYRMPGNKLSIRSFNKAEHPDEDADGETVEIIGRVFWWSVLDY